MGPVRPHLLLLLAALSCRDELVQTARRFAEPGDAGAGALDCQGTAPSEALPAGVAFGEGDVPEPWPLVGSSYGPLEGPGLYVTARDTFRVYVNGHLVGQSERPRTPLFVPVSLLPGENVLAVAVNAERGTPAALVVFEELDESTASGSDWKVSTAPEGDWTATGYDDMAWSSARELGALGSLAGCEPGEAFPADTGAVWIGPESGVSGPIALRKSVRIQPVGFAAGTTGGADAEPRRVTSFEELEELASSDQPALLLFDEGQHDFRRQGNEVETIQVCPETCAEEPERTTHSVLVGDATCSNQLVTAERNERLLHVGSNKTILGLGRGAALRGLTLDLGKSQNLILRNLALCDVNPELLEAGDAFTLSGASGVWLDHVTAKWISDAFADSLPGSGRVTISYAFFDGGTEWECGGQEHWAMTFNDGQVTVHHSRFDQVNTRVPFVQGSATRAHLFNNVYSNVTDWAVGSGCRAQVLLEGCIFENVEAISLFTSCEDSTGRGQMNAVAGSNLYRDGSATYLGGDGAEPRDSVFVPDYDYDVEPATDALPRVILRAGAGGRWAQPVTRE